MPATVEGETVKVGDWVCFKSDIEQSGQIIGDQVHIYGPQSCAREQEWVPRWLHWWEYNNHRAGQGLLA